MRDINEINSTATEKGRDLNLFGIPAREAARKWPGSQSGVDLGFYWVSRVSSVAPTQ